MPKKKLVYGPVSKGYLGGKISSSVYFLPKPLILYVDAALWIETEAEVRPAPSLRELL
jgi:hypothetical protein